MIFTYQDCIQKYKSAYQIKKAVAEGEIHLIEKGIYSDKPYLSTLEIIITKYPNAIVTMDTAFYYHGLTDVIPDKVNIALAESARALRDKRIQQYFVNPRILNAGVEVMRRGDIEFKIYDKERMLIELLRFKNKLPYDYYKEILNNYRNQLYNLDIERIQEYSEDFPKHKMISETLDKEVF